MKVIFLDIDGVLLPGEYLYKTGNNYALSPTCCSRLDRLITETGAKIVISSAWRLGRLCEPMMNLEGVSIFLRSHGVQCSVVGLTPYGSKRVPVSLKFSMRGACERGHEIADWLDEHPEVEKFVIIDDDADMAHLKEYLVKTDFLTGLQDDHVERAIEILNRSDFGG